jgi:hypothetical protein
MAPGEPRVGVNDMKTNPWDRLPDESAAAYARFLVYRNLGPERTIAAAWGATKGNKRQPSGAFCAEAVANEWADRAASWDVHQLLELGNRAARTYFATIERALQKIHDALDHIGPESWDQVLDGIDRLSKYIPQDALRLLLTDPYLEGPPESPHPASGAA